MSCVWCWDEFVRACLHTRGEKCVCACVHVMERSVCVCVCVCVRECMSPLIKKNIIESH